MINLTIQGSNRTIDIIEMANNTIISTNSSQYNDLVYSNYLIRFGEIHTNLTLNTIKLSQNKIVNDALYLVMIGIFFIAILYFYRKTKQL